MSHAKQFYQLQFQTMRVIQFAVIVCVFLLVIPVKSYASSEINIFEDSGVYRIEVNIKLDVAANYVRDVLMDFDHIYRLNPSIIESEILTSQVSNEARVRTKTLFCVPAFCREVEKVDAIRTLPSGVIQFTIIPELSHFSSGIAIWKISSLEDDRTHLNFKASATPDFFIPSKLGLHAIREHFIMTLNRIDHIAKINAKRDMSNNLPHVHLVAQEKPDASKLTLNNILQ